MTIEEKKKALLDYCVGTDSYNCVLVDERGGCCSWYYFGDPTKIELAYEKLTNKQNEDATQKSLQQLSENEKIACDGVAEAVKKTTTVEDIEKLRKAFDDTKDDILARHKDMVNHPGHYESGKFECIDVMLETQGKEAVMGFCICNAFKYLYRHNRKNGIEDVKKAQWYINKFLELAEENAKCG